MGRQLKLLGSAACALTVAVWAGACGGDDGNGGNMMPPPSGDIELKGIWFDAFGFTSTITQTKWNTQSIVKYDNNKNFAILQNSPDDMFGPNKFSKQVWVERESDVQAFWTCTIEHSQDTADAAENTSKVADTSNPANAGCGNFGWSRMRTPIEIAGKWATDFSSTATITYAKWNGGDIVSWSNSQNYAITKNPANAMFQPGKFNKEVWIDEAGGVVYTCTVDFGLDTEDAALRTAKTAYPATPQTSGCGNFAWSKLRKR